MSLWSSSRSSCRSWAMRVLRRSSHRNSGTTPTTTATMAWIHTSENAQRTPAASASLGCVPTYHPQYTPVRWLPRIKLAGTIAPSHALFLPPMPGMNLYRLQSVGGRNYTTLLPGRLPLSSGSQLLGPTSINRRAVGIGSRILLVPSRQPKRSLTTQNDKSSSSSSSPNTSGKGGSNGSTTQSKPPPQDGNSNTNNTSRFRTEAVKAQQAVRQGVHRVEERLQQVLHDVAAVSTGDQLAVAAIVLLLAGLLAAPYVISQMKASDRNYEGMADTDDPVDDFAQLVLGEWDDNTTGDNNKDRVSASLEKLLSDLVQSKALQQAAQKFVLQIVQAPEVKEALQRLLLSLWKDLVEDPETIRQVIHLLAVAIQDPAIKQAALQLVLDVVAEEQVQTALVAAVEKLGNDPEVQQALQLLLTNTTHQTLNDAEILDHSMEFATDVLGDDVVQQTAGEALRNTIKNAFRPAASVGLTATGVGFLLFGILALGYARSSEYEARLLDTAARSLQANAAFGLQRLVTWPVRALGRVWQWMGHICVTATQSLGTAIGDVAGAIGSWVTRTGVQTGSSLWSTLGQSCQHLWRAGTGVVHSAWGRTTSLVMWLAHAATRHVQKTWNGVNLTLLQWSGNVVGWGREWVSRDLPAWWSKVSQTVWLEMQSLWQSFRELWLH